MTVRQFFCRHGVMPDEPESYWSEYAGSAIKSEVNRGLSQSEFTRFPSFLTGPAPQVYDLIEKAFYAAVHRLSVQEAGTRVDIPHSTSVMIVDQEGNLRERFEGVLEADWARRDGAIRALLDERS